jgi:hypothetical protein
LGDNRSKELFGYLTSFFAPFVHSWRHYYRAANGHSPPPRKCSRRGRVRLIRRFLKKQRRALAQDVALAANESEPVL